MPESGLEERILEGLNEVQHAGVVHGDGPLLILAGAGSGKTRVLTHRLAHLIAVRGIDPERILAVTFTNKAAGEMRERIGRLLGERARGLWIGTFHSVCLRVLRRHEDRLGLPGPMTVFDAEDSQGVIRQVLKEMDVGDPTPRARDVKATISAAKNQMLGVEDLANHPSPARRRIARIWAAYEDRLRAQAAVDFDDLLLRALGLLVSHEDIGDRYARQFRHVLVDEYQDTNRIQFLLVQRLAAAHGNICVVGDDDQSIYGWRGADIGNILEFEENFPGATVLRMEQNYRSTTAILDVAHAVIRNNESRKAKKLWTGNGAGEKVALYLADDEEEEARTVARRIREALARGASPAEVAVLYRTHAQSRAIEEACVRLEIPYRVIGGISFYQRREVKDLLAYLRLLVNPRDEVSFRRAALAPRRGAGETTLDRLELEARQRGLDLLTCTQRGVMEGWLQGRGLPALQKMAGMLLDLSAIAVSTPVDQLIDKIVRETEYDEWLRQEAEGDWHDRMAHVLELVEGARSYATSEEDASLMGFLEQVALYAQTDDLKDARDRVLLMTVHNAKGLEFETVFVTGLEEGLFPHVSAFDDPREMEEERRLFYVAATRAARRLFLTASGSRRRINAASSGDLSRFLSEIPDELIAREGTSRFTYALPSFASWRRSVPRQSIARRIDAFSEGEDPWRDDPVIERAAHGEEPVIQREPATPAARGRRLMAKHVRYGIGEVLSIEGEGEKAHVEVRFPGWGVKKIIRSYLQLMSPSDT